MNMTVWDWFEQRSFSHREFSGLAGSAEATRSPVVTLVLPAREVAGTIGPILDTVASLNDRSGLVDQVLVIDADSADGTADIARAHGAEVYSENELLPEYGPAQGKGDAMWRALSVARGDIVMFADADTRDFGEHFLYGTLPKVTRTREMIDRIKPGCGLEVDGGVDAKTAPQAVAAGADVLVAGSAGALPPAEDKDHD